MNFFQWNNFVAIMKEAAGRQPKKNLRPIFPAPLCDGSTPVLDKEKKRNILGFGLTHGVKKMLLGLASWWRKTSPWPTADQSQALDCNHGPLVKQMETVYPYWIGGRDLHVGRSCRARLPTLDETYR